MSADLVSGSVPPLYREVYEIVCPNQEHVDRELFVQMMVKSSLPKPTIMQTTTTVRGPYRSNYSSEDLDNAYRLVIEEHISAQRAAARWGVPVSTLKDRLLGNVSLDTVKSGPVPLFTSTQESFLASHIRVMGEIGYGYTRQETINLASDYAVHLGFRDRSHPLSLRWLYSFLDRWPELKVQKPRKLEAARARSATKENISRYFEELSNVMKKYNFDNSPHVIFNIDEKGLSTDVTPPKIIAGIHCKPQTVTSGKSQTVTMIAAVSAVGGAVPPYFVFPGQRMREELLSDATPGADGTVSETGWSNTDVFTTYMKDHLAKFLPARNADSPVLILYDGHKSHVSLGLIEWARENHIVLFVLPPHTSHLLQPLDIGCYGPFETTWIRACHSFLRENSGRAISKHDICGIACKVFSSTLTPVNIVSSFRKSGIHPFNSDVVDDLLVMPARSFTRPPTDSTHATVAESDGSEKGKESAARDFLESRGGEVLKNVKTYKPRNTLSKIVGGKAITEQSVLDKITEHQNQQKNGSKQNKRRNGSKQNKRKKNEGNDGGLCSVIDKATESVDISKGKGNSNNKNKAKGKRILRTGSKRKAPPTRVVEDNDSFSDSETDDDATCCVCDKFTPEALRNTDVITFVKWAQCDKCDHWVHLVFCTELSVVRRHTAFLCPHCEPRPVVQEE